MNCAVGENLAAAIRGETQILQHMTADNMLNRLYVEAMGVKESTVFLSRTIAQIVHRYPHMDILEIGAGTGGATTMIMNEIERSFNSYTYTDISTGFFERAQEVFAAQSDKITFKPLDCEKDVVEQGFAEHSYDLVIGSLVLHATKDLHRTLTNARRLLKPGGYLVILEITSNDVLWVGFAMSGLPGWWLGGEDGRKHSPCVSSAKWHTLMTETGYSGVDTLTPEIDTLARPYSVLVTQAIDEKVNILRDPLRYHSLSRKDGTKGELAIIGGTTISTIILIDNILDLIRDLGFSIVRCASLQDISPSSIGPEALVLNLSELDSPIFQSLSAESMRGLQTMLDYQRKALWVTQGCGAEQPYMNMSVGFGRTIALEMPDIRLQFLDLEYSRKPDARLIIEAMLKLDLSDEMDGILWSTEPELVQEDGRIMIPRLMPNREANNRYNASRRAIIKETDPKQATPLTINHNQDSRDYKLQQSSYINCSSDDIVVQARQSTLLPIIGRLYGVLGTNIRNGTTVLGFTGSNSSHTITVPCKQMECSYVQGREAFILNLLTLEAAVYNILDAVPPQSTVVIHEPKQLLAEKLYMDAKKKNIEVIFTTASALEAAVGNDDVSWIQIDSQLPKRLIKTMIPANVSVAIDCSINDDSKVSSSLITCLPSGCLQMSLSEIQERGCNPENLTQILDRVKAIDLTGSPSLSVPTNTTIGVRNLTTDSSDIDPDTIVDWEVDATIPVQISTVNDQISLRMDRTYALFGLTSDLAISLCDWMVTRGARNFVLTSRNPNVDVRWLKQMHNAGVTVSVYKRYVMQTIRV